MKKIDIYTDGACSGNPGPGGWGVVLICEGTEKELSGGEKDTTNNKMELEAVLQALRVLKYPCEVNIYSDSAYVVNAFIKKWIDSWVKNGWRTSDKSKVKNKEQWEELYAFTKVHTVQFIKVKGHSDNEYNNKCDKLATGAIEQM